MRSTYETYETDPEYDTMTEANTTEVPEAVPPALKIEKKSENKKVKILLGIGLITVVLLLLLGAGIALLLKSNFEEKATTSATTSGTSTTPATVNVDCDVGPWSSWSSCHLPPGTCGIGSKNRTREELAEAEYHGEKCAKNRIIELAEYLNCNIPCITPVDCKVGSWTSWTACSVTCGGGSKERTREKLADAQNDGTPCVSSRNFIQLQERNTCNSEDCPAGGNVTMLHRKQVGNPSDYFDRNFTNYKEGFQSNGEIWLGLETLHKLTSAGSYGLHIRMKDFDQKTYVAVYDQFEVGPGDGYVLTVGGFNDTLSTLGDSMSRPGGAGSANGMKFSTKDMDQDKHSSHCAEQNTGGWWYNACMYAHPTGTSTTTKTNSHKYVIYWFGGERGDGRDSFEEAELLLVPK